MKHLKRIAYLFTLTILFLASCKKESTNEVTIPKKSKEFQFTAKLVPGQIVDTNDVYAIVSIKNAQDQDVIVNNRISFINKSSLLTEKLQLPDGNYKLVKFFLVSENKITRFAAPVANSVKASQVQKPLSINFGTPNTTVLNIPVEVLKVEANDQPESFGYPAGSFHQAPVEPAFVKIKLRTVIKIGDVVYDSIPANLRIFYWDQYNIMQQKDTVIGAGTQEFTLPSVFTRFAFRVEKWNMSGQFNILKKEVNPSTVYEIGGARASKKLKSENKYVYQNGNYILSGRRVFSYDAGARLVEVKHYTKDPYSSALNLSSKQWIVRSGNQVFVEGREPDNTLVSTTTFTYDFQNRIINSQFDYLIEHYKYIYAYSGSGKVVATMLDDNNVPTSSKLELMFSHGNRTSYKSITDISTSLAAYEFDLNINPFVHIQLPDQQLEHLSKNNLTVENWMASTGIFYPAVKKEYEYDSEGYPTKMITYEKLNGNFRIVSKTEFIY